MYYSSENFTYIINILKFRVPNSFIFELSCLQTYTQTDTKTHNNESPIIICILMYMYVLCMYMYNVF